MTTPQTSRKDVYQIVSGHIIAILEQGIIPWRVLWVKAGIPRNAVTQKPYRGVNVPLLAMFHFEQNLFLTEQQLVNLGGTVKKDERPMLCTFWELRDGLNGSEENRLVLLYERVLNVSQCEGIGEPSIPVEEKSKPLKFCKEIVKGMGNAPTIEYNKQSAFYTPLDDVVHMPPSEEYRSPELYYFELFKMLIHSTGHPNRLDRKEIVEMEPLTKDPFSREELIADIGAHYLCFYADITGVLAITDTKYLYEWIAKFTDDPRLFVFACSQAQKAVDCILNMKEQPKEEEEQEDDEGEEDDGWDKDENFAQSNQI
ncbi:MAG: zincin-like metallopeptidase domain-containing protein [Bacteroidota bacterium]